LFAQLPDSKLKNWAGNLEYGTENLYSATSVDQVRQFIKTQKKLKVLGTRHCFNKIADSANQFLSYKAPEEVISLDPQAHTVTVAAGVTYGHLSPYLDSKGLALHNLASLPHISVAALAVPPPMVPATRMAIWQPPFLQWNSSPRTAICSNSRVRTTARIFSSRG